MMRKTKRGIASRRSRGPARQGGRSRGQSTLEYLVLVSAVVAAVLVFLPVTFQNAINTTLNQATNSMLNMAERLSTSRPLSPE